MRDDANQLDAAERKFSTAAVLGGLLLAGAAIAGGALGMAAAVLGGTLVGYAACNALWHGNDGFPPSACPPERDRGDTAAEPESEAVHILQALTPAPARTWRERVTPAAQPDTVERGR